MTKLIQMTDKVERSLMREGETLKDFCNRCYQHALLNTYATSAMLELAIYEAHGLLLKENHNSEELEWVLNYYDAYKERICKTISLPQDFMEDFFYKVQQNNKAKLHRLLLEISMSFQSAGIERCNLLSHLVGICCMTDFVRTLWKASTMPAGHYAKQFPRHTNKAFFFLDLIDKKAIAIQDTLFPDLKNTTRQASKGAQEILESMATDLLNGKMLDEAVNYGFKENNITPKTKQQ